MALHMGLLGWFNMVVGSEQLAAIFDDRESIYCKTPLTGVVLGCSLLPACSLLTARSTHVSAALS